MAAVLGSAAGITQPKKPPEPKKEEDEVGKEVAWVVFVVFFAIIAVVLIWYFMGRNDGIPHIDDDNGVYACKEVPPDQRYKDIVEPSTT